MMQWKKAAFAITAALFILGCSGLMEDGDSLPVGGDDKLRVGDGGIKRHKDHRKSPSKGDLNKEIRKNEFVVKFRDVPGLNLEAGKFPKTGIKGLDKLLQELASDSRKVHKRRARHKDVAAKIGLDRQLHITTKKSPDVVIAKLEAVDAIEWVEPVIEMRARGIPNDPYYKYQWHMSMLNVDRAWSITQGQGVVVAVVDTGVSANEDGFNKLLKGYDFVDDDDDAADLNGHGSHVAGTIGQKSNNKIGTVGVAPKVSILPVRVLDQNGSGSNTWVAEGIIWAVDNGANIINLSLGSSTNSEVVEEACMYAYEHGVTVIAATGNDGYSDHIGFPAALPTTIAVGSVDAQKTVAFYSNQGKEIDLVAPGGDTGADTNGDGMKDGVVQETRLDGQWAYHFLQGTSMATPHVAGAAALLYSKGFTKPDQIKKALTTSADDLGSGGWDSTYGHGLLNPVAALKQSPSKGRKGKQKGKRKGKHKSPGGGLIISGVRQVKKGKNRVIIGWMTDEPSSTLVRGENGFKDVNKTKTMTHKVTVQGKPGTTVTFTIGSILGGKGSAKAKKNIKVKF